MEIKAWKFALMEMKAFLSAEKLLVKIRHFPYTLWVSQAREPFSGWTLLFCEKFLQVCFHFSVNLENLLVLDLKRIWYLHIKNEGQSLLGVGTEEPLLQTTSVNLGLKNLQREPPGWIPWPSAWPGWCPVGRCTETTFRDHGALMGEPQERHSCLEAHEASSF